MFTFKQLFGKNATQTESELVIDKADLPSFTPSNSNTPESLLLAILLRFYYIQEAVLVDADDSFIVDEKGNLIAALVKPTNNALVINYWRKQFLERNDINYIQTTFVIDLFATPSSDDTQLLDASNF